MKICTFLPGVAEDHISPRVGAIINERIVLDLGVWLKFTENQRVGSSLAHTRISSIFDLLRAGPDVWKRLERSLSEFKPASTSTPPRSIFELRTIRLLAPIPRPPKILAAIVNTQRMLGGPGITLSHPRLDMKAPTVVIGPEEAVIAPKQGVRPEIELAAIVGKRVSGASADEASKAIFGYTIFNDVTAPSDSRQDAYEAYRRDPKTGRISKVTLRGPLFRSKNHDTFGPMGPWIVTSEELRDTRSLRMVTSFNGEVIQEGSTAEYLFTPESIISFVSQFLTLEQGDLVSCGSIGWKALTPGNVDPSEWILPSLEGELELEIESIGVLRNTVRPEKK